MANEDTRDETEGPADEAFVAAAAAARANPESDEAWDQLEDIAGAAQSPDELSTLYREVLSSDLSIEVAGNLGQRAVGFHEEWYAEDSPLLVEVLSRVLEIDPQAGDWAFQRLTVVYTVSESWDALLGLYDKSIAAEKDEARRVTLLEEAAQTAKDFAGAPERAIDYLKALLVLRPDDSSLAKNLARLLERSERWTDLIEHLRVRSEGRSADEVRQTRLRIAELWLDEVGQPAEAVQELASLLEDPDADSVAALAVLQRIVQDEDASPKARRGAVALLRDRFAREDRITDVVGALSTAISFAEGDEAIALHAEAAEHLIAQGNSEDALEHYAAIVQLTPASPEAREQFRALAAQTGGHDRLVAILLGAAESCGETTLRVDLRTEAAEVRRTTLGDAAGAIELHEAILAEPEAGPDTTLASARVLTELYGEPEQGAPRLLALERLASLEPEVATRRQVLGQVARLAAELDEADRALAAWQQRLEADADDDEALEAVIELLEHEERWAELVAAIERRMAGPLPGFQKRADLVRVATVQSVRLGGNEEAIATWTRIAEEYGEDAEAVDALSSLYSHLERWEDLATLLGRAANREDAHLAEVRGRLGDVYAQALGDPPRALGDYRRALESDPRHESARAGIAALCEVEAVAGEAVEALARSYTDTDEWEPLLALLETRLAHAEDAATQLRLLREAATMQEHRAGAAEAALASCGRAMAVAPADTRLDAEVERLAEAVGDWAGAAAAFAGAAAVSDDAVRQANLREREATIREGLLEDPAGAMVAWMGALAVAPRRFAAAENVARLGEATGQLEAAEAALTAAAADDASEDLLDLLATLRRHAPGRSLYDVLMRVADASSLRIDALREAAGLAVEWSAGEDGSPEGDELAGASLATLYDRGAGLWRRQVEGAGEATRWACEKLLARHEAAGDHARVVGLLSELARLPVGADEALALRRRAAATASEHLGDATQAADLYRDILASEPEDTASMGALGDLYAQAERLPELLGIRQAELALTQDPERRLALRLDVARLLAEIEARGGRIHSLRQNLTEAPGHSPSIAALEEVLSAQSRFSELADLLAEQAAQVEPGMAATLWRRLAGVAEGELKDDERALEAHRRVVELEPDTVSLDALARIHGERGEHGAASSWLERRLIAAEEDEGRTSVALGLARSLLAAAKGERAAEVLEEVRGREPANEEIRDLLAGHYRTTDAHAPLARMLAEAAVHASGDAGLELVREAAELFFERLDDAAAAVPVLERGLELAPDDKKLRTQLAEGLREAGRLDEAREVLAELVEAYGRRRSPERAQAHYRLGRVAHAQGDLDGALEQLELATKMAMASAPMLQMLGRLAREAKQLDRAEKAYRALLMVVRRRAAEAPMEVGVAEVLYELSALARDKDDAGQADDLLASALETAAHSDAEVERLVACVLDRDAQLGLDALDKRLAAAEDAASKGFVLAAMANVLAGPLDRKADALEKRLDALDHLISDDALHGATRALSAELGQTGRYVAALETLVARCRRDEDAGIVSALLIRQGEVTENELEQLDAAAALYRAAEATGAGVVGARRALARVAASQGDTDEERRVLGELAGTTDLSPDVRTDVLYRLGEVQLGASEHRDAGVATLREAFTGDPQHQRVGTVLASAAKYDPDHDGVMGLYEDVARGSGDDAMVLDFLERRSARSDATIGQLREAVERANSMEAGERAEELLGRAVAIAEAGEGGLADARWALLGLVDRREAVGDIPNALAWMKRLGELADENELVTLRLRMAHLASQPGGDLAAAAEAYEQLLERDLVDAEVWQPLLTVYRSLADEDRLFSLVERLIDALLDPEPRNAARMQKAHFLIGLEGRESDASDVLKNVLDEQPDHTEAGAMLAELYEKSGYDEDLVDLLERQLDVARDNQDLDTIGTLTLKLGALLEKVRREDAMDVYRRAFDWVPEHREISQALLALFGPEDDARERLELRERLLANDTGEEATRNALALYAEWEAFEEDEGMLRALALGYRGNPHDETVRNRLEARYREREDHEGLAGFLALEAERLADDPQAALDRLLESAALHRDQLGNAAGAVDVLRRARESSGSVVILRELVQTLEAAGDLEAASAEVAAALETEPEDGEHRVDLLRLRARLSLAVGHVGEAVADLEQAYARNPQDVGVDLIGALVAQRAAAADSADRAAERGATLRLVEVLRAAGDLEQGRDVLAEWVSSQPDDVPALIQLRDIDVSQEHWPGVADTCDKLVRATEADFQVDAAMLLADSSENAGDASQARSGLEFAYQAQPGNPQLAERMMMLYEAIGAHRELSDLLLSEAEHADEERRFELLRRAGRLMIESVGDPEAALPSLEAAAALRADDHRTTVLLADAYTASGRHAQAGQLLEQAIQGQTKRRSPELSQLQHRMARLARAAGEQTIDMQWLSAAVDSDKNNGDAAAELAYLAMEVGELDIALNALRAVTLGKKEGPMSRAMAFLLQARIAHQRGEARRALLWARKAKSEDPELEEATEFLRELGEG